MSNVCRVRDRRDQLVEALNAERNETVFRTQGRRSCSNQSRCDTVLPSMGNVKARRREAVVDNELQVTIRFRTARGSVQIRHFASEGVVRVKAGGAERPFGLQGGEWKALEGGALTPRQREVAENLSAILRESLTTPADPEAAQARFLEVTARERATVARFQRTIDSERFKMLSKLREHLGAAQSALGRLRSHAMKAHDLEAMKVYGRKLERHCSSLEEIRDRLLPIGPNPASQALAMSCRERVDLRALDATIARARKTDPDRAATAQARLMQRLLRSEAARCALGPEERAKWEAEAAYVLSKTESGAMLVARDFAKGRLDFLTVLNSVVNDTDTLVKFTMAAATTLSRHSPSLFAKLKEQVEIGRPLAAWDLVRSIVVIADQSRAITQDRKALAEVVKAGADATSAVGTLLAKRSPQLAQYLKKAGPVSGAAGAVSNLIDLRRGEHTPASIGAKSIAAVLEAASVVADPISKLVLGGFSALFSALGDSLRERWEHGQLREHGFLRLAERR